MKKRETELDILRIIAFLCVVFNHSSGIRMESSFGQNILTFLVALTPCSVPIFVMISGRFFLDPLRTVNTSRIKKSIIHLMTAFLFWDLLYQLFYFFSGCYAELNWKGILTQTLVGPYHFWYLYMTICLYAITPFLRLIVQDKKLTEYFLILYFAFSFLKNYAIRIPGIGSPLEQIQSKTYFDFTSGFSGCFILGYYLNKYRPTGKREMLLYVAGIVMIAFTGGATVWMTNVGAEGEEWFSKVLYPNIIIIAAAIYVFCVNRVSQIRWGRKITDITSKLSEYSFGAYLVHGLVLDMFSLFFAENSCIHPALLLIFTFGFAVLISIIISCTIRKIPVIGKKIT